MNKRFLASAVIFLFALTSVPVPPVFADGGKAKNAVYDAWVTVPNGGGGYQFHVDTSPIIFYLGTVNNKYHALLIRVKNSSPGALNLSRDQDSIELRFASGQKVRGILNLPAVDRATWDGLETEIRTAVAYPELVDHGEEEGIYFYVPIGDVTAPRKKHEMPVSILYTIKSLPTPVDLRPAVAAAKA